jgi:AcrR family transcriptional regulator
LAEEGISNARKQVLHVAERLFSERGYAAVTMRDIADELGIRQASLYYHAPQGKEQLFVEVIQESLKRHQQGIEEAIAESDPDIGSQLRALAFWLLSQPPIDFTRFLRSDLPALEKENADRLLTLATRALIEPIKEVIIAAYRRGEIRLVDEKVVATAFIALIDAIRDMDRYGHTPNEVLARDIIDIFLDGVRRR